MNAQPRRDARTLTRADVPPNYGVYAWYRDGSPVYVGKAAGKEGPSPARLGTPHEYPREVDHEVRLPP